MKKTKKKQKVVKKQKTKVITAKRNENKKEINVFSEKNENYNNNTDNTNLD